MLIPVVNNLKYLGDFLTPKYFLFSSVRLLEKARKTKSVILCHLLSYYAEFRLYTNLHTCLQMSLQVHMIVFLMFSNMCASIQNSTHGFTPACTQICTLVFVIVHLYAIMNTEKGALTNVG